MHDPVTDDYTDRLLDGLTPPQREAVTHVDGPLLVLAGPGSGKTRVITGRVAYLNQVEGVPPWNILAITFTNKAAGEMRDRVAALVPPEHAQRMTLCTFHSLCARLLRRYADVAGLPPGYTIYDTSDQKAAVKSALNDLEINSKNFPPATMLGTISDAKNKLITAEAFAKSADNFYDRTVAKVYTAYQRTLERNGAVDFDDLLMRTVSLLRDHRDVADQLRNRYRYVLIDEYQDTNHAQFMIASALASGHQNIMATGDPDQSIYGWRGADIRNILDFEAHYPDAKTVRLEQNYRSTQAILDAADALIQNNTQRKHKQLFTDLGAGEPVEVVKLRDERAEASFVVDQLKRHHADDGVPWSGMAVFYRMNSLSRVLEDELRNAGVPYQIARGTAFYDRKEIKDVVAYLRVVANPADEVNLLRCINTPARGISKKTTDALQAFALTNHKPIDDVIANAPTVTNLNTRAQSAVARFADTLLNWRKLAGLLDDTDATTTLRGLVEAVIRDSGLHDHYKNDKADPDQERLANLGEFVSFAQQYEEDADADPGSLADPLGADSFVPNEKVADTPATTAAKLMGFLERISLIADVDAVEDGAGSVTLMTLHAAKGLEFTAVALVGFEDGLLPHERSVRDGSGEGVEEERRLAFVGITRAMRHLYLTHAGYRTIFGQTMPTIPSRFLRELPRDHVREVDRSDALGGFIEGSAGQADRQRRAASRSAAQYPPGALVRHPRFGLGRVVEVSAIGTQTRASVDFNTVGPKTLVLQYAGLELVSD